jgi:hypothetical protein
MATFNSVKLNTVHLAFVALFPGFFFYQSALGSSMLAPFVGGYFSPVSLIFMPLLLALYLAQIKRSKRFFTKTDLAFFIFLLYFIFVIAFNFADGAAESVVSRHLVSVVHFVVIFIIFRMADFSSRPVKWTALLCLLGMTAIIFVLSNDGFFNIKDQGMSDSSDIVASYEGFARSYILTFVVVMPYIKSLPLRVAIYCICVPALFLNGARSEFIMMVAAVALTEIFYAKRKIALLAACLAVSGFLMSYFPQILMSLPESRILQLFDLSHASSWEARDFLFHHALQTISAHPFLGDYASYAAFYGPGSYAHNIFSAWVDLGLFGFVYFLCMVVLPMCFLFSDLGFRNKKIRQEEFLLTFVLMLSALLLLFTAKNFTYMLTGAALGRYAAYSSIKVTGTRTLSGNSGISARRCISSTRRCMGSGAVLQ